MGLLRPTVCLLFGLLPGVALLAPKGVVVLLALAVACSLLAWLWAWRRLPWPPRGVALSLGLFALWAAASLIWVETPGEAALRLLRALALLGLGLYLFALLRPLDRRARQEAATWLLVGFLLAFALAAVETALGFPLLTAVKGEAADFYHYKIRFNRGMTAFAILVWPLVGVLLGRGHTKSALLLPAALLPFLLVMESSAAVLAWLAGALVFLLLWARPAVWRPLTLVLLLAAGLGAVPLALGLGAAGLADAKWLANNSRYRVHLWEFVAERVVEKPLSGWGFDAARNLPNFGAAPYRSQATSQAEVEARPNDRPVVPLHPHNAALELLLDLGAVGLGLAGLILWALLRPLGALAPPARAAAVASLGAALAVAMTAFGLWQGQWLALLCLVATFNGLSVSTAKIAGAAGGLAGDAGAAPGQARGGK